MKGQDESGKEHSTEVESKKIPVKQPSKHLQTRCKVQLKKARHAFGLVVLKISLLKT